MVEFYGPKDTEALVGLVDNVTIVPPKEGSQAKSDRLHITLVDVTRRFSDGTEDAVETSELYIPTAGAPAAVFSQSARKVLGITDAQVKTRSPEANITARIEGKVVEFALDRKAFTTKEGVSAEMRTYRVVSVSGSGAASHTLDEVREAVVGKTPAEAMRLASQYPDYAGALKTSAKTREVFGVKLVEGKYQVA